MIYRNICLCLQLEFEWILYDYIREISIDLNRGVHKSHQRVSNCNDFAYQDLNMIAMKADMVLSFSDHI